MKRFQLNKQYLLIALYALGVILAAGIFGLIVFRAGEIAAFLGNAVASIRAVPYGILFAIVLYPFITLATKGYSRLLERKRPRPRLVSTMAILSVYIVTFLVLAILLLIIIPPMIGTVTELAALLRSSLLSGETTLRAFLASLHIPTEVADTVVDFIKGRVMELVSTDIAGTITSLLGGIVGQAFDLVVGVIISIYLLAGRRLLSGVLGKLFTAILPSGMTQRLIMFVKRLYANVTEFLSARLLSALFLGISSYLVFYLLNIPFYPLLTLVIMILNLFPVFGTIFSFLLCMLVLLVTRPAYALPVAAILIALELFDNFVIEPRTLTRRGLRRNIGATLVLLLVGYAILGIWGALLAIPVFATVHSSLRAFSIHLLNRRNLPTDPEDYRDFDIHKYLDEPQDTATEEGAAEETQATRTAAAEDGESSV